MVEGLKTEGYWLGEGGSPVSQPADNEKYPWKQTAL